MERRGNCNYNLLQGVYIYIYCIRFEDVVLKKERRERKKENKKERGRSKDYVSRVARMRRLIYDGPKVYDRLSCD